MRINRSIALATGLSRRAADQAIADGRVLVNGKPPQTGQDVTQADQLQLDGRVLAMPTVTQTIMLNKPTGYVVSRDGQGSKTVYDLLPPALHTLKPVGRLDKESSGLLLLTNDGQLAQTLTHPSTEKTKVYEVVLNKPLAPLDQQHIIRGVQLEDGPSQLALKPLLPHSQLEWRIAMHEGRNRQIRRTFAMLGYTVTRLHRTHFGPYTLNVQPGQYEVVRGNTL